MRNLTKLGLGALLMALPAIAQGNNLGSYSATNEAYVIFGTVDSQLSGSNSLAISYSASDSTTTGNTTNANNIQVDGSAYDPLDVDPTNAIAFVQDGAVGIRANGEFSLTLQMPLAKVGSACVPIFTAGTADASVSAYLGIALIDGSTTVESYVADNKAETMSTNVTTDCSTVDSDNIAQNGTITFDVTPDGTTEYSIVFDIGFEIDGSFTTDGSSASTFGDNGEPVADVYTLALTMTASSS